MMPAELRNALADAILRHPHPASPVFTFVTPGPHGLPVRPRLLTEHENGDRVYSLNGRQARKLIQIIDAEATS